MSAPVKTKTVPALEARDPLRAGSWAAGMFEVSSGGLRE